MFLQELLTISGITNGLEDSPKRAVNAVRDGIETNGNQPAELKNNFLGSFLGKESYEEK